MCANRCCMMQFCVVHGDPLITYKTTLRKKERKEKPSKSFLTVERSLARADLHGGPHEPFLATVKRWKLTWLGYVTRHDSLTKAILQGTFKGRRCHGQQRKCWMDDIKEWTSLPMPDLLTRASCRKYWKDLC